MNFFIAFNWPWGHGILRFSVERGTNPCAKHVFGTLAQNFESMNRPLKKQVLVWGNNNYGQLGLGCESKAIMDPRILNVPNTTWTQVACGLFHTAAVSSDGEVFTWGYGYYGQLGHGDRKDRTVPTKVEIPGGEAIVKVACGDEHTAAVTATGKCFTWYVSCLSFLSSTISILGH